MAATYHPIAFKGETFVKRKGAPAAFGTVTTAQRAVTGFTILEVMIVVAIVAILAAIALPNYSDYVKRGKIIDATTALSDLRTRYEQYFLDNRTYVGGCLIIKPIVNTARAFDIDCPGEAAGAYTGVATGKASEGMANFTYKIDQTNAKTSTITEPGWGNQACGWVTRKDGSCS
jgi:type IV pilus assembly protein PilE